jgi:hypothetical protein
MLARDQSAEEEAPLSPEQQKLVGKVRRLMLVSGFATLLGIAVVIGVIGYRVFRSGGSAPLETTTLLPKGARIVSTTGAGDRVIVVIDVAGTTEIRAFDARTLQPAGRLKFAVEP